MKQKYLFILFFLVLFSCNKNSKELPPFNVPGIKTNITKIQVSPLAFDGAIVVIIGTVISVKENTLTLADEKGSTLWVKTNNEPQLSQNDQVLVSGIFRRSINTIEADQIIKVIVDDDRIRPSND